MWSKSLLKMLRNTDITVHSGMKMEIHMLMHTESKWMIIYIGETTKVRDNMGSGKGGCTCQISDFFESVSSISDKRNGWVYYVFMDFQKAFDVVPHRMLVKMLDF